MVTKAKNWRPRGIKWSQTRVGEDFFWGTTDCGTLVRRLCGVVYMEDIFPDVPEYSSLREAKEVWDNVGTTEDILMDIGCMKVDVNHLRTLDIVVMEDEFDFRAASIFVRSGLLISSVDYGVDVLKRKDWPEDIYGLRLPYEVELD